MNRDMIIETVNRLFIEVDNKNWEKVEGIFSDKVLLDYTSMAGGEAAEIKPKQITESWKGMLPGFDKTHHQLGNYLVTQKGETAEVFCYGTATHYLANESGKNVWTVVGSYELEVVSQEKAWRVHKMKFNLKYIDGNNELPKIAQQRLNK